MTRVCKCCGETKQAIKGVWVTKHGKPNGRICLSCKREKRRQVRSTEEGRAKTNASSVKSTRKIRATPEGRAKHNAASVKSQMQRLKTDAWYRLKQRLAKKTSSFLKAIGRGKGKDETILAHFGATREEVYAYLDIQLRERGFSWENHGWQWVGDHIRPLALAQDSNELVRLCHLPNLQVLTPDENRQKGIEDRKLIREHEAQ